MGCCDHVLTSRDGCTEADNSWLMTDPPGFKMLGFLVYGLEAFRAYLGFRVIGFRAYVGYKVDNVWGLQFKLLEL